MPYVRSYSVPVTRTRSHSIESVGSSLSIESAPLVCIFEDDETFVSLYVYPPIYTKGQRVMTNIICI
jgi:hypothetical protein